MPTEANYYHVACIVSEEKYFGWYHKQDLVMTGSEMRAKSGDARANPFRLRGRRDGRRGE